MKKKLIYFSSSPLPSFFASSVNVTNMVNSFSKIFDQIDLVHRKGLNNSINKFYKINSNINLLSYSSSKLRFLNLINSIYFSMFLKNANFTIIYGRNIAALSILCLRNYNVIIEVHEPLNKNHFMNRFFLSLIKKRKNLGIVHITKPIQESFLNYFNCKQIICSDAANDNYFPFIKKNLKSIGYVGSINKGRGINLILSVAKLLPEYYFHIIGGEKKDIKKIFNKNIPNNIIFHGKVYPKEVYKYFGLFQIAVAPYEKKVSVKNNSDTSKFMSPLKIFEYMASNKVILTSDHDVLKEVLNDKKNAIIISNNDPDKWAGEIKRINSDINYSKNIAKNAYNEFKLKYSWDLRATKIINNFKYLLK